MDITGANLGASALFFLETYHCIAHLFVLLRIRMLPRKDLVRQRYYFLADTLTVFVVCFLYTGALRWIAVLQMIQHLYYFFTWDSSALCKKVISWSSLDWLHSPTVCDHWAFFEIVGTIFDTVVHAANMYVLGQYMTNLEIIVTLIITKCFVYALLFNRRWAWSRPDCMPAWVQKRLTSIPGPSGIIN